MYKKTLSKRLQAMCARLTKQYLDITNIVKDKNSKVNGALWNMRKHEKELDWYEGRLRLLSKEYFKLNGKKVLFIYKIFTIENQTRLICIQ